MAPVKRRDLLAGTGAAALAASVPVRAQRARATRIGFISLDASAGNEVLDWRTS